VPTTVPTHWYDPLAGLGIELPRERPAPEPVQGLKLNVPKQLVRQSMGRERLVPIPEPVREAYARWRPSPLVRARALEKELGTPARIYYKDETRNLAGTHKLATALAQAHYYREAGVDQLVTCTAAGQWGTAIALATSRLDMACTVYMVRGSYDGKPARRTLMEMLGASVVRSPSDRTDAGRAALADDPDAMGALGLAMTEAVEHASGDDRARWILGGSEPFAILHTTVIGLEAIDQLRDAGDWPDVVIGYMGGGKNLGGITAPFLGADDPPRCVAVESAAYPALTRGTYAYDSTDASGRTPMAKMYTLGRGFATRPIRAQGMRYHGASKVISALHDAGRLDARAYQERPVFDAAVQFARVEGVLPSPEASYAVRAAVDEAVAARDAGEERVILFCLSDHGMFDTAAYQAYVDGEVSDVDVTDTEIKASLEVLDAKESTHAH
jgi:tryptophan synthase beta chain